MKLDEFTECMQTLAALIPQKAPPDITATAVAWYPLFAEMTAPQMMAMIYSSAEKFGSFPSIKDLKDLVTGSAEDNAKEIGQRIWATVGRYGSQMSRWPEIKAALTPLGEQVVDAMGGWQYLCDTLTDDQRGTFIAQTRDLAISLQKRPIANQKPELGEGNKTVLEQLGKIHNLLSLN